MMLPGFEDIFECLDWKDRHVHMTRKTYDAHIPRHPEIPKYLAEVQEVIHDPDVVMEGDNGAIYLYRFGIAKTPPYSSLYLMAVLYYSRRKGVQSGTVATFFFTDELSQNATIVEHRAQVISGTRITMTTGEH